MPRTDYNELNGTPEECRDTNWVFDTLQVEVPYMGINAPVELRPLGEGFEDLAQSLATPKEGMAGSGGAKERQWLNRMQQAASATKAPLAVARMHPSGREKIQALAEEAHELIKQSRLVYEDFDQRVTYPPKTQSEGFEALDKTDQEIWDWVDRSWANDLPGGAADVWDARESARANQRERIEKAIALLWCAEFGRAQSEAWRANKAEWESRQQEGPGAFLREAPEVDSGAPGGLTDWQPSAPGEGEPEEDDPGPPPDIPEEEEGAGAGTAIAVIGGLGLLAALLLRGR